MVGGGQGPDCSLSKGRALGGAGAESFPPALWMRKTLRGGGKGVVKGLRCQGLPGGPALSRREGRARGLRGPHL